MSCLFCGSACSYGVFWRAPRPSFFPVPSLSFVRGRWVPSSLVSVFLADLRRLRRGSCSSRLPVPASLFRPFVPPLPPFSAPFAGSALFVSSPSFLAFVASGRCPVSLCLSVFRWPVRSAVLLVLLRVSVPSVLALVPRSVLVSFVSAGLRSLGFPGSASSPRVVVLRFLGSFSVPPVPSFSGRCFPSAVASAFSSLSRCLLWLCSAGRGGCPGACRGALAGLVSVVSRFLSRGC